ncbi:acetate--CoA ligase family protein [Candidatus Roizmanbacteria bacterium]|nr:MAG: acetate--CoA ligase family protein [Candidatus Roizmanbacteria bacterium]
MNLKRFFNPRSVAIVGVSEHEKKVGHLVAHNMIRQGYSGEMYFIHPSGAEILGKKTLTSLKEIRQTLDLVVLAVPSSVAVSYLDEVAANGCHNVVMFAAGFGETHSPEGSRMEEALQQKIKEHDITLLGPNCIGYINTHIGVNATFFSHVAPKGNTGIISQSGALGTAFLDYVAAKTHVGLSNFISLGNKSVLNESDCLDYLLDDPKTEVIGMYLEDVINGERFLQKLQETTKKKPVVILKSGKTREGSKAAMSHTGSMAGDDEVFDAAVRQAGALRADSYAEFEMILKLYSLDAVPANKNILVLSNAGGMGVLLTDEIISQGLHLITVSEETTEKLSKAFEDTKKITVHNPIDLLGDASAFDYKRAINLTMEEKDIGAVIVLLTPQANTEILETAHVLRDVYHAFKYKPIYPIFMGKDSVTEAHHYLEKEGIASFRYFSPLPKAIKKILEAKESAKSKQLEVSPPDYSLPVQSHIRDVQLLFAEGRGKKFLSQHDALSLLSWSGIPVAKTYLAVSSDDLKTVVKEEGFPLVAKIASEKITHKTEVKGVITGITVMEELQNAFDSMRTVGGKGSGCYLQKQYSGHELIIGSKRDITFGTIVLVGLGGIYAELLHEAIELVYPFSYEQFAIALKDSKLHKLTSEFRNIPPIDPKKLYDVAFRVGLLVKTFDRIREIDINPLIASGETLVAVDGRVILSD